MLSEYLLSSLCILIPLLSSPIQAATVPQQHNTTKLYAPLSRRRQDRNLIDMSSPKCVQYTGEHLVQSQVTVFGSNFNDKSADYYWYEGALKGTQPNGVEQSQFSFVLEEQGNIQLMSYDRQPGSTLPKELMIQFVMDIPTLPVGWYINTVESHTCHVNTAIKLKNVKGIIVKHR